MVDRVQQTQGRVCSYEHKTGGNNPTRMTQTTAGHDIRTQASALQVQVRALQAKLSQRCLLSTTNRLCPNCPVTYPGAACQRLVISCHQSADQANQRMRPILTHRLSRLLRDCKSPMY